MDSREHGRRQSNFINSSLDCSITNLLSTTRAWSCDSDRSRPLSLKLPSNIMSLSFSFLRRPINKILVGVAVLVFIITYFGTSIRTGFVIGFTPIIWKHHESEFLISLEHDNFDVTFGNYSANQVSSQPDYEDRVPPILHHITLGSRRQGHDWNDARDSCLKFHEGWENHLWTDETADAFVAEKFPHLKSMWHGYRFPIQRIDALRYMILYEYGGGSKRIHQFLIRALRLTRLF